MIDSIYSKNININIDGLPGGENGNTFRYNSSVPVSWGPEPDFWVYDYW